MAIKLKYQGQEKSKQKNQASYRECYIGKETEIDTKISSLTVGTFVQGKGYITAYTKSQQGADIWQVDIQYTISYANDFSNADGSVVGIKSATLSVRNLQMPLQSNENYKTCWNYYLAGLGDVSLPSWSESADDTILEIDDRKQYMWIKNISQLLLQPNGEGKYWRILQQPTKPGVEYYDLACFVVTESAKYLTATAAGNAVSKNINTVCSPTNTFGLTGEFKLDQVSVSYNGQYWIAQSTYTMAGDENGWDADLYG